MERLKSILADKILDLSANSGDEVKAKIDKIQRFRDFANALKSLMVKYPAIEDELIEMVNDGDFDTKIASSRVDTVIRLADAEAAHAIRSALPAEEPVTIQNIQKETPIENDIETIHKEIAEEIINEEVPINPDDIPMEIYEGEEEPVYEPEDISYEEIDPTPEEDPEGYIPFENVNDENTEPDSLTEQILENKENTKLPETLSEEEDTFPNEEELAAIKRKVNIRRIIQVAGIILGVVALIFIIKFVMVHWKTILIVAGILLVLAILITWLVKRKR
ncbi:hypothetical protein GGR21_002108 [Dysgonomonas hofstadii]|uniref:Uncharacterized protein n=1 Tax=Dysgonomonas hofstadii TaxID=637886 RepID=A0A840CJJ1_9BACT|nr:phage holin family protein [Dysgonomonas hofstadii]MBB4036207.1 hypothetical protein [Dysgonomonas hofstadii]